MILQKLVELYNDSVIAKEIPSCYDQKEVRWIIELTPDGRLAGFTPTMDDRGKGHYLPVPHLKIRTSTKVDPILLCDESIYVFGKPEIAKAKKAHDAFKKLIKECSDKTEDETLNAVVAFLDNANELMKCYNEIAKDKRFRAKDRITFRVIDVLPIHREKIKEFWYDRQYAKELSTMQCLIDGEQKPVMERLDFQIRNVVPGSSGILISFNKPAFTSYGLENSLNAPTCKECGEKFTKALNSLLDSKSNSMLIGNVKYVFWVKEGSSVDIFKILQFPNSEDVKEMLKSLFTRKRFDLMVSPEDFYAIALSFSPPIRVVLRDWIVSTVENVKECMSQYFQGHRIYNSFTKEPIVFSVYGLANAIISANERDRRMRKVKLLTDNEEMRCHYRRRQDAYNRTVTRLISNAIKGDILPSWICSQAVTRCRVERSVPPNRAALIKLWYFTNNNNNTKEDYMVSLEQENKEPAYLCGRLLAMLESIQFHALGKVGSTIVDRFYGTASSAPASVFGPLVKGAVVAHLPKIRKDRAGLETNLQKELQSLVIDLSGFPKTLGMQGQALFALGYYHQRAAHFAHKKEDAKETVNHNQSPINQ